MLLTGPAFLSVFLKQGTQQLIFLTLPVCWLSQQRGRGTCMLGHKNKYCKYYTLDLGQSELVTTGMEETFGF